MRKSVGQLVNMHFIELQLFFYDVVFLSHFVPAVPECHIFQLTMILIFLFKNTKKFLKHKFRAGSVFSQCATAGALDGVR